MLPTQSTQAAPHPKSLITVGIDVGGVRKGFHAVALANGKYLDRFSSTDEKKLALWCRVTVQAQVIAIDAPCRWSNVGRSRPAERALMQKGIWCFSTPTLQLALQNKSNYYGWMFQGEKLYNALAAVYPLCNALPLGNAKCCFETFPHAITWHLRGGNADASQKRTQRSALLKGAGITSPELSNIDLVDAALCALAAWHAASGKACVSYGVAATGLIIVPK